MKAIALFTSSILLLFSFQAKSLQAQVVAQAPVQVSTTENQQTYLIDESVENTESLISSNLINLLNWKFSEAHRANPEVVYNRKLQFGRWIQYKKTPGCFDVRSQVLVRDSLTSTSTGEEDKNKCTVLKGSWADPYSGKTFTNSSEIQIDHMVPLKEAYVSGAANWSRSKRCVYANFLNLPNHLVSVSNFENQSKADKTPAEYIPANAAYVCEYLKHWLEVKLVWKLSLTKLESDAILQKIAEHNCPTSDYFMTRDLVNHLRDDASRLEATCPTPRIQDVLKTKIQAAQ